MFAGGIGEILKTTFRNGSVMTKIIYINIGVYLATKAGMLLVFIFGGSMAKYFSMLNACLDLPGDTAGLKFAPWTPFTYMFTHYGILHLAVNMLLLFWFGRRLKDRISAFAFAALYAAGGFAGAAVYLFMFRNDPHAGLAGASAAVMAVLAAQCTSAWKETKNVYIFAFILLFELLQLTSPETSGRAAAHLGGAAVGIAAGAAIVMYGKKRNREPEMFREGRVSEMDDREYNARKRENEERVNASLDKVSESGYESLTIEEKNILFKAGRR